MIRGIGDPLVACYARAYLCRVGLFVAPNARTHLMPNFTDYLYTVQQVSVCGGSVCKVVKAYMTYNWSLYGIWLVKVDESVCAYE